MIRPLLTILFACLAIMPAASSSAAENPAAPGDIVIMSDRMDQNDAEDSIIATGNVVIRNQGMTITSDKAVMIRSTRFITANGNVSIEKDGSTTYGDTATMDVDSGRVEIDNAAISMTNSSTTIFSKKFIRESETSLILKENEFTACELPDPSWKFKAKKMDVNPTGYAVGRNVIFYIKDVPVFYLPWMAFPVTREKQSGVLPPRYGYSGSRGLQLDIPYYWNIAPNQDATFDLDMLSSRGVGFAANYRYYRKVGSIGTVGGYIIYDTKRSMWRGQFVQNHTERFSSSMNFRSAINLTSDQDFLREFAMKIGDYNRQSSVSTINFLKSWENYAFTTGFRYSQSYYNITNTATTSNTGTAQTLPEFGLAAVRQRLFSSPLYFDLDSTASNFYREKGLNGQRAVAFPRLSLFSGVPGYLHFSAYAGAYLRSYSSSGATADAPANSTDGNIMPEVGAKMSTSLSKVYELDSKELPKLRHEIIPEVSYRYAPDRDQSRIPFFDYTDRLIHQNIVYYGITSQLSGKFKKGDSYEYREINRIRLMQGYSINGTRRDLLTMVDQNKPMTDIILESETWLTPYARFIFDARYDVYDNRVSSASPGLEFDNKKGNIAALSYRMASNRAQPLNSVEYAELRLSTKMFQPWTFNYLSRYSFDKPGFLVSVYSAEYRHQCWSINAAFYDRPGNPGFTLSFNLQGMSSSAMTPLVQ